MTGMLIFIMMVASFVLGAQSPGEKAVACEVEALGWDVPDLEGVEAELSANDEVDGKIYKREAFVLNNTSFVATVSRKGRIFTYIFDTNKDAKIDYWIVDGDGDGIFETLCYPNDKSFIPEWVKK